MHLLHKKRNYSGIYWNVRLTGQIREFVRTGDFVKDQRAFAQKYMEAKYAY
jgi:uncharacterized protein YlbG (UPF0298 family)